MLIQFSERRLEDLLSLGVSRDLVTALYPMATRSQLKKAAEQVGKGTPMRRSWRSGWWNDVHIDPANGTATDWIISSYETFSDLLSDQSNDPARIEPSAAIMTIEHCLSYCENMPYTADGIYSVIKMHLAQCSKNHCCPTCEKDYWTFVAGAVCPHCHPVQMPRCAGCGEQFLIVPGQGRPPRYCPTCRAKRGQRKQGALST